VKSLTERIFTNYLIFNLKFTKMKKVFFYAFLLMIVPALVLTSCTKDDDGNGDTPTTQQGFALLKDFMKTNNFDLDDMLGGGDWIATADAIYNKGVDDYYIMDIRSQEAYDAGHIEGAVHSSLVTIVADAVIADKQIIVVCYTGQSAGHAVMALRLSGYSDAQVLKWGMCSWNDFFTAGYWPDKVGNAVIDFSGSWIAPPGDIMPSLDFGEPTWTTTTTDPAELLAERVSVMTGAFNGIGNAAVLENFDDYFINNYWDLTDVEQYGNITGSFRIKPLTLENSEYANLDPDMVIVTYCWTGQTSSMITAWLTILGYEAVSLTYGANGMIYDDLTGHKWSAAQVMNYPYVSTK